MDIQITKAKADLIDAIIDMRSALLIECCHIASDYDWNAFRCSLSVYYETGITDNACLIFVAKQQEKLVGMASVAFYQICPTLNNLTGKCALLIDMYVSPEFRNRGIGMSLLTTTMQAIQVMGYRKVQLNATEAGKSVYTKYGFLNVSGEMSYIFYDA